MTPAATTRQCAWLAALWPGYALALWAGLAIALHAEEPPLNPLRVATTGPTVVTATGDALDGDAPSGRLSVSITDDPFGDGYWNQPAAEGVLAADLSAAPDDHLKIVSPPPAAALPALQGELVSPEGFVGPQANAAFPAGSWLATRLAGWFHEPWFGHSDPNDPFRHVGLGQPLVGTSWRNRPIYLGAFVGGVLMDDLTSNVYQNNTSFVGLRLGHDFDHYWGVEGRWAFARPELETRAGEALDFSRDYFADVSLVHYPFGDASWRPYVLAGLGFQTYRFGDESGQRIAESVLSLPLGFGLKYYCSPWFTLRFDFADNIGFGNARVKAMQNVSLMVGGEFRFGGSRPSYYPWHASTSYW